MKAILIDAYRHDNKIILWLKTQEMNIRIEKVFYPCIYMERSDMARTILEEHDVEYKLVRKNTYDGERKEVYESKIYKLDDYEKIIRMIEKKTKHRLILYNADIHPEQNYLYKNNLKPFSLVELIGEKIIPLNEEVALQLDILEFNVYSYEDIKANPSSRIRSITIGGIILKGDEKEVLEDFVKLFIRKDPDVISMDDAFAKLPYLVSRLKHHGLKCPFHRWDDAPITSKGGKTFFSYGKVMYRNFAVRLKGRFLIDSVTTIGSECNVEGIMELSYLSGTRFQQIASRSFGAAFQSALVREMIRRDYLVPFKEKPVDSPLSLYHQLKFDRVGHTFDSLTGLHHDVAEIDFSSLFPWIIYNYNVSTETILGGSAPYQEIPWLPLKISLRKKGIVPTAIKPLLDRRMHYKKNPTLVNKNRIMGLKWVLVTSYGYLRFREFKLGIASSHMAIGSFARQLLIKAKEICESKGFRIIHGIVDSLYIQKKSVTDEEVKDVCREIELECGIPVSFEGIFKWIVFLPSVNDDHRPVPTHYFGILRNNEIKARGIEVRQTSSPMVVRKFQKKVLEMMADCSDTKEIGQLFPLLCQLLRKTLFLLHTYPPEELSCFVRISKTDYKNNIPQKAGVEALKKRGITILPGQPLRYIFGNKCVVIPDEYDGKPDVERYKRLLVRALFIVLQPFGFTRADINEYTKNNRQAKLEEYFNNQKVILVSGQVV